MNKAALRFNLSKGSEPAAYAGVLARTSADILSSAHGELTDFVREMDARHPLRERLGEIGCALESAGELNRQLIHFFGLAALQAKLAEPTVEPSAKRRRAPETQEPAMVALVVESDDGLRGLMGAVIRKQGYQVLEARTAEEAERIAASVPFLVNKLVTEVLISGASGVALGSRLRLLQPHMGIVYTVCEAHEAVVPNEAMGGATVLKKPFTVAGLSDALRGAD